MPAIYGQARRLPHQSTDELLCLPDTGIGQISRAFTIETKNPAPNEAGSYIYPGGDLLSHAVTHAVPSALEGLTSVFGMGTGVSPPP